MNPPPRRPSLFGPLLRWELVRLARRGQTARARVLLLYALLLALVAFAVVWSYLNFASPARLFRGSTDFFTRAEAVRFGESLALVLLETQLLLVVIITPAYAAAAIAEEKDRHTLTLLLDTELTDREIVWGKAAARVVFVLSAVAAGVPVLMLTLFFGGVDVPFLAAGYALTAGTVVLCAAIGVSAGCHASDTRAALVRAYAHAAVLVGGLLVPPFAFLSPFAMLAYARMDFESESLRFACGFGYPVGQVAVAWAIMTEATRALRRAGATAGPPERTAYPEPPRGRPAPVVFGPPVEMLRPLPPIDDADPVLWKERHAGRTNPLPVLAAPVRWLGGLFAVVAVMLFASGGWQLVKRAASGLDPDQAVKLARNGPDPPDGGGAMMVAAAVFAAGLYLLPLAVGVAGCVAGERHRGTLDPILLTLLGRRAVLQSKVRAHVEAGLVFGVGAVTAAGCGFGADGGARLGLAAMAAVAAGFAFVLGLGAWLSVRCDTPVRAFRLSLPAVVAVVGLPVLVRNAIVWGETDGIVNALAWAAAGFAAAAAFFWWRAGVRIEKGNG